MGKLDVVPLISIIVPVYNSEKYLRECIDSVLNQTYENVELILIDDGSKDSSGEICDFYDVNHGNVHTYHIKNNGAANARNIGIEKSNGQYIMFLDSDDWLDIDICDYLYERIITDKVDISICFLWDSYVDAEFYVRRDLPNHVVMNSEEALLASIKKGQIAPGPVCKLIKRGLFTNIRFIGKCQEDYRVTYQLLSTAKSVSFSNVPKYHCRNRKSSVTHDGRPLDIEWWNATKIMLEIVRTKFPLLKNDALNNAFFCLYVIYYDHIMKVDNKTHDDDFKRLLEFTSDNKSSLLRFSSYRMRFIILLLLHFPSLFKFLLLMRKKWIKNKEMRLIKHKLYE